MSSSTVTSLCPPFRIETLTAELVVVVFISNIDVNRLYIPPFFMGVIHQHTHVTMLQHYFMDVCIFVNRNPASWLWRKRGKNLEKKRRALP